MIELRGSAEAVSISIPYFGRLGKPSLYFFCKKFFKICILGIDESFIQVYTYIIKNNTQRTKRGKGLKNEGHRD